MNATLSRLRLLLLEYHNQSRVECKTFHSVIETQKTFQQKQIVIHKTVIAFALRVQKFWMTQILVMDAQSLWRMQLHGDLWLCTVFFFLIISKWTLNASDCSVIRTHSIISYPVDVVIYVCILYICFVPYSTVWLSLRPPVEIDKVRSCSTSWSFNE